MITVLSFPYQFKGLLNKVFMFDKVSSFKLFVVWAVSLYWPYDSQGCTFLCVFGLPHAKHEDDAARALKTARHIFNNLSPLGLKYGIQFQNAHTTCTMMQTHILHVQ